METGGINLTGACFDGYHFHSHAHTCVYVSGLKILLLLKDFSLWNPVFLLPKMQFPPLGGKVEGGGLRKKGAGKKRETELLVSFSNYAKNAQGCLDFLLN